MSDNKELDDLLKNTKAFVKQEIPKTAEEYLIKRAIDIEEQLKISDFRYNALLTNFNEILELNKKQSHEDTLNHLMLVFIWDNVLDRYDDETCTITAGNYSVKVPGKLQDTFHLWQSFKDNPEGGGV